MTPFNYGGDMIETVSLQSTTFTQPPQKFEAGTPNIAGVIGLAAALDYVERIGIKVIAEHELGLLNYAIEKLTKIPGIKLYTPEKNTSIISLTFSNIHAHDIASMLNDEQVAVRAGHHCCMPLMSLLSIPGTVRISFALYNTQNDVDRLLIGLQKAIEVLR